MRARKFSAGFAALGRRFTAPLTRRLQNMVRHQELARFCPSGLWTAESDAADQPLNVNRQAWKQDPVTRPSMPAVPCTEYNGKIMAWRLEANLEYVTVRWIWCG